MAEIGYSKAQQVGEKKAKDTRTFHQKYGKPLDRKKYKWNPKKAKPIRKVSAKVEQRRKNVMLAKLQKKDECPMFCQSCGLSGRLTPSHILPQAEYPQLAGVVANIQWHCHNCHTLCENLNFWMMADGLYCFEYVFENEKEPKRRFWRAITKYPLNYQLWQVSRLYDPEKHLL